MIVRRQYMYRSYPSVVAMTEGSNELGAQGWRLVHFIYRDNVVMSPYSAMYEITVYEENVDNPAPNQVG